MIPSQFDLRADPWIPILDRDARTRRIPLREAFERAHEIRDLACGPAERISLLRLLICVAQAAQDPPSRNHSPEWRDFTENLAPAALAYLDRDDIRDRFRLFGEGHRFLQVRSPKTEGMATSKLFFHLASGGNPTHLDHGGGDTRAIPAEDLALGLLTFQNFSPLLGRGFKGRGVCVEGNAAHAFQCAPTLADTIAANCISLDAITGLSPEEALGRPVWEMPPAAPFPEMAPETRNATASYLGRLVPASRAVWLVDATRVVFDNGPAFPSSPAVRESSTALVRNKKDEYSLLPLRLGRGVWRDLHALAVPDGKGGPATLQRNDAEDREIFVGGLITDFKASIHDSVSSFFAGRTAVPARLFTDADEAADARLDYLAAIRAAETWQRSLWGALGRYFSRLTVDPKQTADFRAIAEGDYWSAVETALPELLRILRTGDYPEQALDHPYAETAWHRSVREAAARTYRRHAPRGNARQLEAFTSGLRALWPKNPTKSKQPQRA